MKTEIRVMLETGSGRENFSPRTLQRKLSAEELMLLNCGVGEDS